MRFDRSQIENLLPGKPTTEVAHYSRIGTLCHLIKDKRGWNSAWATPVQFLNDRLELLLGLDLLREAAHRPATSNKRTRGIIEELLITPGTIETDAFQMSFSGNPDELGQWRGYAANGMGCSIVTEVSAVRQAADVAGWVIYDPAKQRIFARKILDHLRRETDHDLIAQVLVAAASYMKHEGFRPEMEYRLLKFPKADEVKFRESGDRLVPYVDYLDSAAPLPIHRIIIGPGWRLSRLGGTEWAQNHVVQGIQRLLDARGMYATDIESSAIPYDPK